MPGARRSTALDVGVDEFDSHVIADIEPLRSAHDLPFNAGLPDADAGALLGRAGHDRIELRSDPGGQQKRGRRLLDLPLDLRRVVLLLGAVGAKPSRSLWYGAG